ncbi:MAG: AI-2E family transporter [bacterium]
MPKSNTLHILIFIAAICVILQVFLQILGTIFPVLSPFIISGILAYLLFPLVRIQETRLKFPRPMAIIVCLVVAVVLLYFFFNAFIPPMFSQVSLMISNRAEIVAGIQRISEEMGAFLGIPISINIQDVAAKVFESLQMFSQYFFSLTKSTINVVTYATLVFIITFFLLLDPSALTRDVITLLPNHWQSYIAGWGKEVNAKLTSFLRGQLLLCFSIFLATLIGGLIIGIKNVLLLAIIAGILEAIPIIGPIIAAVPMIMIAAVQNPTPYGIPTLQYVLVVLALNFIIQRLENNLLVPLILGKSVNLQPILVLFVISLGGYLAGFLGMFLAVPLTAVLAVSFDYAMKQRA